MGNLCVGKSRGEEQQRNENINKMLRDHVKHEEAVIKLLLLGPGESGKSTIAKQMKLIHTEGFTQEERMSYVPTIHKNIIVAIRALVKASAKFGMILSEEQQQRAERMMEAEEDSLTESVAKDAKELWADPQLKATYNRQSEFQLADCSGYYLDQLTRISDTNFVPTDQDILRSRVKTTGIIVTEFNVGATHFRMLDVGGQRSERRKWIHCFDDVTAVIFCVALSEYDLTLHEDQTVNRMHESLKVFQEICQTKWLEEADMILFLNKRDLFEEKIKRVDLTSAFPEYIGGRNYDKARHYIRDQFLARNSNSDRLIYVHYTCATDTNNITVVFNAVRSTVLNKALESGGL